MKNNVNFILSNWDGDFLKKITLEPCDYEGVDLVELIKTAREQGILIITGLRKIFYSKDLKTLEELGVFKISCMMGNTWSYTLFLNKKDHESFLNVENERILKTHLPIKSNNEIVP